MSLATRQTRLVCHVAQKPAAIPSGNQRLEDPRSDFDGLNGFSCLFSTFTGPAFVGLFRRRCLRHFLIRRFLTPVLLKGTHIQNLAANKLSLGASREWVPLENFVLYSNDPNQNGNTRPVAGCGRPFTCCGRCEVSCLLGSFCGKGLEYQRFPSCPRGLQHGSSSRRPRCVAHARNKHQQDKPRFCL